MGSVGKNAVWQDREIRFDVKLKDLNLRKGEFEIDHLKGVEDTKGNTGETPGDTKVHGRTQTPGRHQVHRETRGHTSPIQQPQMSEVGCG